MSFILNPNWSDLVIPCLCLCPSCFSLDFIPYRLCYWKWSPFLQLQPFTSGGCLCQMALTTTEVSEWYTEGTWPVSQTVFPPSSVTIVWPTRIADGHFLYLLYRSCPVCTSVLWIIRIYFFFFPEWLCSWQQQSSFGSGKNNLAALAQRQMSPQIRCHGSISAPVLASSRDFHTSHWCVQEICVQMLLQKAGSHFASAFSRESFHNRFALLSCSVCCCSLLLVRAAAFPACLPHLSRMSSSFVYRHMLVIH